jgi:hypothetical protein
MDDNVGHTSNDTSALTSLDEDPFGGSRSLENPEYSDGCYRPPAVIV